MDTTTVLFEVALALAVVAVLALVVAVMRRVPRERIQIEMSRTAYLDEGGKERVSYSFGHDHPRTTWDHLRVALARRRFHRLSNDDRDVV
ncbi:hypothetical protein LFL96_36800 (plasmid) [Paraburkholderia sp. D15]|uniref:hypothetical protein n=1 Tax=Paraburkholderia sp. D15 TaxID=2880218 RepID=UPI002479284D|nr:hypothetical protein [Paraburkholderia sp. D15]WGS55038.1 hypothetical protein LFL96_36800 [Paraburkholderia sp. D15]